MRDTKRGAWFDSFEGHEVLLQLMDDELRRDCGIPLAWYDVLIRIWLSPGQAIRMSELADQVLLSRSWLTRRVVKLEEAGLIERRPAEGDGRGVIASLTDRGRTRFAAFERSHARSIKEHFSDLLSDEEAAVVASCFRRLADRGRERLARSS